MAALIESYRGAICAWECDFYGHLNVQFYVARLSDAAASVLVALGMGPASPRGAELGFIAVNQTIDYKAELLAGDLVVMKSGIKTVGKKSITVFHKLINAETGAISMMAQVTGVLMDLETRKAVSVPDDVRTKAERMLVQEVPA